jgi:hypothetical protein
VLLQSDGWMDEWFHFRWPLAKTRYTCGLPQVYISVCTCVMHPPKTNLKPRRGLSWLVSRFRHGTRLRNLCDTSTKSKTACTILARGAILKGFSLHLQIPLIGLACCQTCRQPSPGAFGLGPSAPYSLTSRTCITLFRSPQTHRSSSRKRKAFVYVDRKRCPVSSCVRRYARFSTRVL